MFDPAAYRVVLFDQRNCGRSTPHASRIETELSSNTTAHLLGDIERLREHLGIERWMLYGGSWGSTLALAYAVGYPQRVSEMILFGVTTGRHREIEWLFRGGVSIFFPEQWERLRSGLPAPVPDRAVVDAYYELLNHADISTRQRAADAWCLWESATVDWPPSTQLSGRFTDPAFALAFARIVTHYMHHNLFLEDGALMRGAGALADIPGRLVNGRFDFQAPIADAWELRRVWPRADLVIVDEAGHSGNAAMTDALIRATDDFR
jgi:proline iminopeptidase